MIYNLGWREYIHHGAGMHGVTVFKCCTMVSGVTKRISFRKKIILNVKLEIFSKS